MEKKPHQLALNDYILGIPDKFYGEVEGIVSRGMMDGTLTNKVGEQIVPGG